MTTNLPDEAHYRTLLDQSSDPIFSFSSDIRYSYANPNKSSARSGRARQ